MSCRIVFVPLPAEKEADLLKAFQLLTMLAGLQNDNGNYTKRLTFPPDGGEPEILLSVQKECNNA